MTFINVSEADEDRKMATLRQKSSSISLIGPMPSPRFLKNWLFLPDTN
jgi:hypothetical protein